MVNFLFALIGLFSLSIRAYGSGVIRQNVYSSAVFTGVDLYALKFYLDRVVPNQPFLPFLGIRKVETLDYPTVKTASLCAFPRFDTIPDCGGRAYR